MNLQELYSDKLLGAISGLDRIRLRGTLRWIANETGIRKFVAKSGILLKDFGHWARRKTLALRESCERRAEELGVEARYLHSSSTDKENLARGIAKERGIRDGSICMLSVVEPCWAPDVEGNRAAKKIELRMRRRQCVWLYHYFDDPVLGFGHVRLQTWLPFTVNVCLNGRHWLEKELATQGVGYVKGGNCFPWIADIGAAQRALDGQIETDWPRLLNSLLLETCPDIGSILSPLDFNYYWSAEQTEWAADLMFRRAADLDRIYPSLIRHAMMVSDSPSVMRYLGKRCVMASGKARGRAPREIVSDYRRRHEGARVKHVVNRNSVKAYNKGANILRIETTMNDNKDFKAFRPPDDDAGKPASWQPLRKGVIDLRRRCEVSSQSNERYSQTLAAAQAKETVGQVVEPHCNPVRKNSRRARALNPWNITDHKVLKFLAKGEWTVNGFRNKDLRAWLWSDNQDLDPAEKKRLSAKTTRWIRLLRDHSLVRKVPHVNRYIVTEKGLIFAAAMLGASALTVEQVSEKAA
jgi:hypothetical protein